MGRKSRRTPPSQPDNYAEFTSKIDAAREQLQKRAKSIQSILGIITYTLEQNRRMHADWEQRLSDLNEMIDLYDGNDEGYKKITELQVTAKRMEHSFRLSVDNVEARKTDISGTSETISKSMEELDEAKRKLEVSRQENEARARLDSLTTNLSSAPAVPLTSNNHALHQEIAQARLAIASAQALVEIKDPSHV